MGPPGSGAQTNTVTRTFLSAEWRDLVMLNYEVDGDLLRRFVPSAVALDSFGGTTLVSLVGFRFVHTRIWGVPIPFHCNFDEVNLRLYVQRRKGEEVRRGVVFIREIVPRVAIAIVARLAYNEPYVRLPMKHSIRHETRANSRGGDRGGPAISAQYSWRLKAGWSRVYAEASGAPVLPQEGSLEQYVTEHYWGYGAQREGECLEYQVKHVPWRVWSATKAGFDGDVAPLYGPDLARVLRGRPHSAFLAEGSPVTVLTGRQIL